MNNTDVSPATRLTVPALAESSPHLLGVLRRLWAPLEIEATDRLFAAALDHGGRQELDFERSPGESYNPRPARVALIAIRDAACSHPSAIRAVMAATVLAEPHFAERACDLLSEDEAFLAKACRVHPAEALDQRLEFGAELPAVLGICLWLDRARHIHRAAGAGAQERLATFFEESHRFVEIASQVSSPLHNLAVHWQRRFRRRHLER